MRSFDVKESCLRLESGVKLNILKCIFWGSNVNRLKGFFVCMDCFWFMLFNVVFVDFRILCLLNLFFFIFFM